MASSPRGVARLARALREECGLVEGDRVAIAMRNCPEFLLVLFATWHAGLVAVPMNFRLHRQEFRYIIDNSGAKVCFVSADLAPTLNGLESEVETLDSVIRTADADFAARRLGFGRPRARRRAARGSGVDFLHERNDGTAKGATLTHRNLGFMTQAYFADIDTIGPGDAMLHPAALSHGAGLYCLPSIAQGGRQVVCEQASFDPGEVLNLISTHRNVVVFAAPTMLKRLTLAAKASDMHTQTCAPSCTEAGRCMSRISATRWPFSATPSSCRSSARARRR